MTIFTYKLQATYTPAVCKMIYFVARIGLVRCALEFLGRIWVGLGLALVVGCMSPVDTIFGPIPWGHSGPLCHALSLSLSSSLYGVVVDIDAQATPGEWACGGSQ